MNEPQFSSEYLEMVERLDSGDPPETPATEELMARRSAASCSVSSSTPENERYLWLQLEDARRERERARTALRDIREGIANEEENGLWEADIILSIIDRALSPENSSLPNAEPSHR